MADNDWRAPVLGEDSEVLPEAPPPTITGALADYAKRPVPVASSLGMFMDDEQMRDAGIAPETADSYSGIERKAAPLPLTRQEQFRLEDDLAHGARLQFVPNSPQSYVPLNPGEEAELRGKVHTIYDDAERTIRASGAVQPDYVFQQRPLYGAAKYELRDLPDGSKAIAPGKNGLGDSQIQFFDNYGAYTAFLNANPGWGRMGGATDVGGKFSRVYLNGALDPNSTIPLQSAGKGQPLHQAMRPSEAVAMHTLLHEYDHGHNGHGDEERPEAFAKSWLGRLRPRQ